MLSPTINICLRPNIIRAADNDAWLRHILEGDSVKATKPRLKEKYIQNKVDWPVDRPWAAEISGRVLSKALDIVDYATKVVTSAHQRGNTSIKFRHVTFASVASLREVKSVDVFEEKTDDDAAHANLVFFEPATVPTDNPDFPKKISIGTIVDLLKKLEVCEPDNLSLLESLRITTSP